MENLFAGDPNTWDGMTWELAAEDLSKNGPTGQAFAPVMKFAEELGMTGNQSQDLSQMASSKSVSMKNAGPLKVDPMKNLKDLFGGMNLRNPNKNPYPGRTALGRNAGEIFGNAMEQR